MRISSVHTSENVEIPQSVCMDITGRMPSTFSTQEHFPPPLPPQSAGTESMRFRIKNRAHGHLDDWSEPWPVR